MKLWEAIIEIVGRSRRIQLDMFHIGLGKSVLLYVPNSALKKFADLPVRRPQIRQVDGCSISLTG